MPNSDEITIDERYKYLRISQKKYGKGGRLEQTRMLDEMEQVTGCEMPPICSLSASRLCALASAPKMRSA